MRSPRKTGARDRRMGPQMEPMRATVFEEQEEEEPAKETESEQTEGEEGGVIEVQGGRGFNWATC